MRERREISAGAHRTLGRHARQHIGVVEREQRVDELAPHAGETLRQRHDLQRQREADYAGRQRFTDAHGMRQHQIALQELELIVGNVCLREASEAGIHAVGRLPALHDGGHGGRSPVDIAVSGFRNRQLDPAARQIAQGGEIDGLADL